MQDGFVTVDGLRTYYRVEGTGEVGGRRPMLVLHGGPGLPHDYLEALTRLADTRRVFFYDQIGCGRSERPPAGYPWSVARFAEQIDETRRALQLEGPIHVYGQSFGGFLALEHALAGPPLASLVLANTAASIPVAAEQLRALGAGDPSPEAQQRFMEKHFVGGVGTTPESLARAFEGFGGECYAALWGSEPLPTGPLLGWDVTDRLGEISVPTLVFNGRNDQLPPACGETIHRGIVGSRFHVFEGSAHLPYETEPEEHDRVVRSFLDEIDGEVA